MAKKVQVILTDDLDETKSADETITFGLDGTSYEIDLSKQNAKALRDALAVYVGHSRKVRATRRAAGTRTAAVDRSQTQAIREWAKRNGHDVSDRGRIPAKVVEAFNGAH